MLKNLRSGVREVVPCRWRNVSERLFGERHIAMSLNGRDAAPLQHYKSLLVFCSRLPAYALARLEFHGAAAHPARLGAPLSSGQSPPAQSKANVIGSRFAGACASTPISEITTQIALIISLNLLIFLGHFCKDRHI